VSQILQGKEMNVKLDTKNKDLMFSEWYDALEGTKSQGFAYKAWCAGWNAANQAKLVKCECVSPERCDLYDRCLKGEKQ
jgi:hypothetical protein